VGIDYRAHPRQNGQHDQGCQSTRTETGYRSCFHPIIGKTLPSRPLFSAISGHDLTRLSQQDQGSTIRIAFPHLATKAPVRCYNFAPPESNSLWQGFPLTSPPAVCSNQK
jgi:hypothetical protein